MRTRPPARFQSVSLRVVVVVVVAAATWNGLLAQSPVFTPAPVPKRASGVSAIDVQNCAVDFAQQINVPALETGRIAEVTAVLNDMVAVGDPIASLDRRRSQILRRQALLKLSSAKRKASDDSGIHYAKSALKLAEAELDSSRSIQNEVRGAVPYSQIHKLQLTVERGKAELALAERGRRQAEDEVAVEEINLSLIDDQVDNLQTTSPIGGVVLELTRSAGEWIERGETIATIARIDRLHVRGFLSGSEISPAACRGLPVSVHWVDPLSGVEESLRGKVLSVDPQLRGGQFRLHAEVVNQTADGDRQQWLLQPGAAVTMKVHVSVAKANQPDSVKR